MKYVLAMVLVLVMATGVFAASSATITRQKIGSDIEVINIAWTAATNGSFTSEIFGVAGCLFYAVTNPGAVAPTDNYDITISNADGIDLAATQLTDRDTANSEAVKITTIQCVNGDVTLAIANNSVNSATGVIRLFFGR
jgi:hypothetical protein